VQLQPSLALQTLDYFKAMRDFNAAAGLTSSNNNKIIPLKQVKQQLVTAVLQQQLPAVLLFSSSAFPGI
jgi:hypothetical protein